MPVSDARSSLQLDTVCRSRHEMCPDRSVEERYDPMGARADRHLVNLQCDMMSQWQRVWIERGIQPGRGDAAEVARDVQVAVALGQGGNAAVPLEDRPLGRVAAVAAAASRRGCRPRPAPSTLLVRTICHKRNTRYPCPLQRSFDRWNCNTILLTTSCHMRST